MLLFENHAGLLFIEVKAETCVSQNFHRQQIGWGFGNKSGLEGERNGVSGSRKQLDSCFTVGFTTMSFASLSGVVGPAVQLTKQLLSLKTQKLALESTPALPVDGTPVEAPISGCLT